MKITITASNYTTELDGVPVRLWYGVTERGTACQVFVHRLAVEKEKDQETFELEMIETSPPFTKAPPAIRPQPVWISRKP